MCRKEGYRQIKFEGRIYFAHRLAWLYFHGKWPAQCIDHIDGDKCNNRIANLRDVSVSVNMQNQRAPMSDNKSGFLGVVKHPRSERWKAHINVDGMSQKTIGWFDSPALAHQAYVEAKRRHHAGCTI